MDYGYQGGVPLGWDGSPVLRFGAQGGIRTRNALENFSSVARVTAVHTLGRLPRAADRAILPLRTPYSRNRARARHTCPGQSYPGKAGKLKPSQRNGEGRSMITIRQRTRFQQG